MRGADVQETSVFLRAMSLADSRRFAPPRASRPRSGKSLRTKVGARASRPRTERSNPRWTQWLGVCSMEGQHALDGVSVVRSEGKMPSLRGNHFERRSERGHLALELAAGTLVGRNGLECSMEANSSAVRRRGRTGNKPHPIPRRWRFKGQPPATRRGSNVARRGGCRSG